MTMNKTLGLALLLATSVQVQAQSLDREAFHAALDACVSETGVARPERGSRPSDEDRAKIDACLAQKGVNKPERPQRDPAVKAAMEECLAATGLTRPERGERPSEEDRATLQACLSEKGISLPQGRGK